MHGPSGKKIKSPRRVAWLPLLLLVAGGIEGSVDWASKVDPWVFGQLELRGEAEFVVFLEEQADLGAAAAIRTKADRGRFVFEQLKATAERSQPAVLVEVAARGLEHRPFWVANMILVRGDRAAVASLAAREEVRRIHGNVSFRFAAPRAEAAAMTPQGVEPNLVHIGAPDFWAAGFTGQGAVVAGGDTGFDWNHPALLQQYRGWDGANADHNYNWHDAVHSGGGSCGADSPEPCDDGSHGTRTMGVMVGDDGAGNQVGVAPGARWIGCRNLNQGFGTVATYSECFQFFIAPTDLDDENPRPDLAPDVVNGSWSCAPSPQEDCDEPNALLTVVENVRAAGIVVSQAASNAGSECSSMVRPPAIYEATFAVGAVDNDDDIASFSARGPVTVDGSNRLKPEVTAPGVNIRSSIPGTGYASSTGTSFSAPHASGLVALLISAQPCLQGDPDALEQYIKDTAASRTTTQECGGVPGDQVPNNTYGFGSIRAVEPGVCLAIFSDGFESGDTSAWSATVP